jgi:4-hydroxybenzoate polyprenyltransferase
MTESIKEGSILAGAAPPGAPGLSRLKLFLALSRTPHGLLDLATAALAAVLWCGGLPPVGIAALGLLTVFAGYTAVYALNDVVDRRVDREKLRLQADAPRPAYLDAVWQRHPLAAGDVSLREGLLWTGAWAAVALAGAYALNPVCALIFLAGCLLEAIYCLLLRVSQLRVLVSGLVKTLGGLAAVFAVDPHPAPHLLLLLLGWLFFWEVGGQNIPADWHDLEEDRILQAQTVPVCCGPQGASVLALGSLAVSVALSLPLLGLAPAAFTLAGVGLTLAAGLYLLILPAFGLYRTRGKGQAAALFNRASYYPLSVLLIILFGLLL